MQPHRDHDLLQPRWMLELGLSWAAGLGRKRRKTAAGVRGLPAKQAAATASAQTQRRDEAVLTQQPDQSDALADDGEVVTRTSGKRRPTAASGEEPEPWTFLVRVPKPSTMRVAELLQIAVELIHAAETATDRSRVPETTRNFN
jgi:hypothetical protein